MDATTLAAVLNNLVCILSLNKSSDGADRILEHKLLQTAGAEQRKALLLSANLVTVLGMESKFALDDLRVRGGGRSS